MTMMTMAMAKMFVGINNGLVSDYGGSLINILQSTLS